MAPLCPGFSYSPFDFPLCIADRERCREILAPYKVAKHTKWGPVEALASVSKSPPKST